MCPIRTTTTFTDEESGCNMRCEMSLATKVKYALPKLA